jgi:hypothetical protein
MDEEDMTDEEIVNAYNDGPIVPIVEYDYGDDYGDEDYGDDDEDYGDDDKVYVHEVYVPICNAWVKISNNPVHWKHVNYLDYVCEKTQQIKIDWTNLSHNPQAISFIDQPLDKINWGDSLIDCVQDSTRASVRNKIIYQELMQKALHPSRVLKWIGLEDDEF